MQCHFLFFLHKSAFLTKPKPLIIIILLSPRINDHHPFLSFSDGGLWIYVTLFRSFLLLFSFHLLKKTDLGFYVMEISTREMSSQAKEARKPIFLVTLLSSLPCVLFSYILFYIPSSQPNNSIMYILHISPKNIAHFTCKCVQKNLYRYQSKTLCYFAATATHKAFSQKIKC